MKRRSVLVWLAAASALSGLAGLAGLGGAAQAQAPDGEPLRITSISPAGENVPLGRQIVLQFNRPVVPIGRMQRDASELPIRITPALQCQWRWLDPSALACQLADGAAFRPATRYTLSIEPGIEAEDGATIAMAREHVFLTQRPRVQFATFATWRAPSVPVIRVVFNQPVAASSVADHIYFETQFERRAALSVEPDENDRELPRFIPLPGEGAFVDFGVPQAASSDDDLTERAGEEARRVWLLSPSAALGDDLSARLRVEPGLVSADGPEPGDEARVVVEFDTFPEYRFLGVACRTNANRDIRLLGGAEDGDGPAGLCGPLQRVGLAFSAPTIASEVRDKLTIAPDLAGGRSDYDPWANQSLRSRLGTPHRRGNEYVVWLPERLQAAETYRIESKAGALGLLDEFGRGLADTIDLQFETDHRPPDFTIVHSQAVIEAGVDSEVPLYVTNLDSATLSYRRLTTAGRLTEQSESRELPEVEDVQYAVPLGIRDLLDGGSGAIYGRVYTNPSVSKFDTQRSLFAQVTPWQLHVKLGHFNTLVWVTDLATGEPVEGAEVSAYVDRLIDLSAGLATLEAATTDAEGIAILPGTSRLDPDLSLMNGSSCASPNRQLGLDWCERLFIRVQRGSDLALMPLDWRFEINTGRISNYTIWSNSQRLYGHVHSWGTTAQGVYRAGDTIEYKLYVRAQSNETYVAPPPGPYTLNIIDPTGRTVHSVEELELSAFGAFDGAYALPENAALGWYRFELVAGFAGLVRQPLRVLVTDFTPASFSVTTTLNGDIFDAGSAVEAEARAELFSGGPYTQAEGRVTAVVSSGVFTSNHPLAAAFRFDSATTPHTVMLSQASAEVDEAGIIRHRFEIPEDLGAKMVYGTLAVDGSVRDDRGRYVASAARARFLAVDRLVGLRNTQWVYSEDEPAAIEHIVVDADGNPAAGTAVSIEIERLETRAARVRGAGNAFLTQFVEEWIPVASCASASTATPSRCEFTPESPGRHRARARIVDTRGRVHTNELGLWVQGAGRVVWNTGNDDSLQIVPERTSYSVGDTARYLIQNPFPEARALVTVERYGVISQWVEDFDTSTPIVEFEVGEDYLPGFFLSVLLMSPRVEAPLPEPGEVDLGKPAFKLGYVQVPVADPYKRIEVDVRVDEEVYKPRDTVRVRIDARPLNRDQREPIEAAVVVLDEAVLDLIQGGTTYYDPYEGFFGLDGLDVRNYGLLTRLVGRQRIELKGANAGGDGGSALDMRQIFDYVAYWNPSLELTRGGRGEFEFTLPDNLTGWRVLVLAMTPTDRMGLGQGELRVNLPTEVRPVMPNQVTEGDRFRAGFSVSNRTDLNRDIEVSIAASGDVVPAEPITRTLSLAPYERQTVYMDVAAARLALDRELGEGRMLFEISAGDSNDTDALRHELPVLKQRVLETAASYGSTDVAPVTESLRFPDAIYTDVGEVGVDLAASVLGNLDGAFRYLRDYSYVSWEQKLTKGVMASHFARLGDYLSPDIVWPGSAGLPRTTLAAAASYQAPNGGMAYFVAADAYVSPYLSAYTALAFNWLRDAGHAVPVPVEERLHAYLDSLLRRDLLPSFYSRGMASTVRAVSLAALAAHGGVARADLERYRNQVDYMSLFGKAQFLTAAQAVAGAEDIAGEVLEKIMATSVRSAGKLSFNETLDDGYYRILSSVMRTHCAVLSALTRSPDGTRAAATASGTTSSGKPSSDETSSAETSAIAGGADGIFELVRTITQTRGNRSHWENTQENVFCMQALIDYSQRFESVEPDLSVAVALGSEPIGQTSFSSRRDAAVSLARPITDEYPGRSVTLSIEPAGWGRLYYAARMSYAPTAEASERQNAGIDVRRELSVQRDGEWVLLDRVARIARGELVRVDIFLSLPTAGHFVVVDDPVPGGLEPVNRDLATSSFVDADAGEFDRAGGSWWFQFSDWRLYNVTRYSFHHQEMAHSAVRYYSDYLPPGNYELSYTAQAIAEGEFEQLPVHAEQMYDPDVFGTGLRGRLTVVSP